MTLLSLYTSPLRHLVLAVLAVGAILLSAQQVWACETLDKDGNPRDCTFLEEFGECLYNAQDSHDSCDASRGDESWLCDTGLVIDAGACAAGAPLSFLGKLIA
jgi:hypothetical protein